MNMVEEGLKVLTKGSRKVAVAVFLVNTGSLVTLALLSNYISGVPQTLLTGLAGLEVGNLLGIALGYLAGREEAQT